MRGSFTLQKLTWNSKLLQDLNGIVPEYMQTKSSMCYESTSLKATQYAHRNLNGTSVASKLDGL